MTVFIGIVSGKGGVGKTTASINLAAALLYLRRQIIAVDANLNCPDLSMHLGAVKPSKSLHSSLAGKHDIRDAVHKHSSGLLFVPGSISYHEGRRAERGALVQCVRGLTNSAEVVIADAAPGLGRESQALLKAMDAAIIMSTPDLTSAAASLRMQRLAKECGANVLGVVVNRQRGEAHELSEKSLEGFLGMPLLGIIPEDPLLRTVHRTGTHIMAAAPNQATASAFKAIAARLIGERYKDHVDAQPEPGLLSQLISNLGLRPR